MYVLSNIENLLKGVQHFYYTAHLSIEIPSKCG